MRVSHTAAAGLDLMRYAIKCQVLVVVDGDNERNGQQSEQEREIDFLTTESGDVFPIQDFSHLHAFNDFTNLESGFAKFTHLIFPSKIKELVDMGGVSKDMERELHETVQSTSVLGKSYFGMTPYALGDR